MTDPGEAALQLKAVGADELGTGLMEGRMIHLNLKVEHIPPRVAHLLKQAMRDIGGDAAVDGRGLDCSVERVDTLLTGSREQMEKLLLKLDQDGALDTLKRILEETLKALSKSRFSIRCRGKRVALGPRTLIMGILNVTPDSFSDGGLFFDKEKAIAQGLKMVEEGADFLDIGGESTRPGSKPVDDGEEIGRVVPVIASLSRQVKVPISIDTRKSVVARKAIDAGAQIINDVSGLSYDPELAAVAAKEDLPIVLMHIRGVPETMQKDVHYSSLFSEILQTLKRAVQKAESAGVDPGQILVDPGIGFGKGLEDNLRIIRNLSELRILGKPILLGTSRKTFIGKILDAGVEDRLEGTLSSTVAGVMNGAHVIRCHDVLPVKKAIAIADAIRSAGTS
jgi:dihydropteroate synthase